MKYPALALMFLPLAAPALAHPATAPHAQGADWAVWGSVMMLASLIGFGLRTRLREARVGTDTTR